MAVTVPTLAEIKREYETALNLTPKTKHVEAEYLKAKAKVDFGDDLFTPVYHAVVESPSGTVVRLLGTVFIDKHKDAQLPLIRRYLETIRTFIEGFARGRKRTTYIDWESTDEQPEGTYWSFGIKAVFVTV